MQTFGAGSRHRSLQPQAQFPAGIPSPAGQRWHWLPTSAAAPCNVTLESPGRPTTKKLRPRQQLAVSSQELPLR